MIILFSVFDFFCISEGMIYIIFLLFIMILYLENDMTTFCGGCYFLENTEIVFFFVPSK